MIPRLYDTNLFPEPDEEGLQTDRSFLGTFSHLVEKSVKVTEERNGSYILDMQCTIHDECADMLIPQRFIEAEANPKDGNQFFEISSISRTNTSGIITIQAKHISNILFKRASEGDMTSIDSPYQQDVVPYNENDQSSSLWHILMNDYLVNRETHPLKFTFHTGTYKDVEDLGFSRKNFTLGLNSPATYGDIFGHKEGSMLDVFGGEFWYRNLDVKLCAHRGEYKPYRVRYGQNIGSASQSMNSDDVYTCVMPYGRVKTRTASGSGSPEGGEINIYGCRTNPHASTVFDTVKVSDVASGTEGIDSEQKTLLYDVSEQLKNENVGYQHEFIGWVQYYMYIWTRQYIINELIGYVTTDIEIKSESELEEMKELELCDTVDVVLDKFGVTTKAKITKVVYDVVNERWVEMTIGKETMKLADYILRGGVSR